MFFMIFIFRTIIYIYKQKNMKRIIRLTESGLRNIVKESVKRAFNEVSTDTLHNAYQKTNNLPAFSNDPKIRRRFRQRHAFGNELEKRHSNEISAIDPDTAQGYRIE